MKLDDDAPLLDVGELSVRFPSARGDLSALDDVSLTLRRGTTLGIVGESGSGKSVLARAILGLLPRKTWITSRHINFAGANLATLGGAAMRPIRGRRIAMVFQDPMTSLNPVRTIGSQMAEGMITHLGVSSAVASRRALDLLKRVGVTAPERRIDQYPHELSGGMRQRVVIAMAIACEPELLIADEPTTALDVTVQAEVLALLRGLQQERQMAMILITHDLGVAAGYTDEIAVMYAGQIVERALTRDLLRTPRMPYTRALLGSIPRLDMPSHVRLSVIPGRPTTIYGDVEQCRFAQRCALRADVCLKRKPTLTAIDGGRIYRCWNPIAS